MSARRDKYNSIPLKKHFDELRDADKKALIIKQNADEYALNLAREIQTYKDEQHNGLLKQLGDERVHYVSQEQFSAGIEKLEILIKPLTEFMVSQIAAGAGARDYRTEQRDQQMDLFNSPTRATFLAIVALIAMLSSVGSVIYIIVHG
jgi:hypothetical protein